MKNPFNFKTEGSIKISLESKLFDNAPKPETFYMNPRFGEFGIPILAIMDIVGFWQIMSSIAAVNSVYKFVIIAVLAIAFEGAPLYIGYTLSLRCYQWASAIHKWVLGFSVGACMLGIVGNTVFRIFTMDIAYPDMINGGRSDIAVPLTVLMIILPVITTLFSLTLGCLTFDPLLIKLKKMAKNLSVMKIRKQQSLSIVKGYDEESIAKESLLKEEERIYDNAVESLKVMRKRLREYSILQTTYRYKK